MRRHPEPAATRVHARRRRRTPLLVWILAAIGLATVIVLAFRYAVVPLLVMLEGMA